MDSRTTTRQGHVFQMTAQVHPIFPEAIVEFSNTGIDQSRMMNLYESQQWADTNADDDAENFLKISKNLKVLNEDQEIKKRFVAIVNEYASEVMRYTNKFHMTTSWFVRTERNKISVLHNHGNAMLCAVYYFGQSGDSKSRITFEKPFLSQFDVKPTTYNIFNGASHNFEMGNDTVLVFPAYLKHKVLRHDNAETRKSLAMNFMPSGLIGSGATELYLSEPRD